jgi:hypothetical protein
MTKNRMEMGAALARLHEFTMKLEQAGITDDLIKMVITSKGNYLGKAMYQALMAALKEQSLKKEDSFKLIASFPLNFAGTSEEQIINTVQEMCGQSNWRFDERLAVNPTASLILFGLSSKKRADIPKIARVYQATEFIPEDQVYRFIREKGYFPGVFGLCALWIIWQLHAEYHVNEKLALYDSTIFGLEEMPTKLKAFLVKYSPGAGRSIKGNFGLSNSSVTGGLCSGQSILVIENVTDTFESRMKTMAASYHPAHGGYPV